jgi:hypothetical protein
MLDLRHALVLAAATVVALAAVAPSAHAAQGSGNPILQVSSPTLPATGTSTITVTGLDYLVPPHAPGASVFGGVYVFFGWVRPGGAWGPSIRNSNDNDGNFGVTYTYTGDGGDPGTRDDGGGIMRFVSFTPGGASGSSTPFHMDGNGNWSTTMVVPGSTYTWSDPFTGSVSTVNCRQVQCGVFTIGAHGKASATNERFTPVNFVTPTTPTTVRPGGNPTVTTGPPNNPGGGPAGPAGTVPRSGGMTATTAKGSKPGVTTSSTAVTTTTKSKTVDTKKSGTPSKSDDDETTADETTDDETTDDGEDDSVALEPISDTGDNRAPVLWTLLGLVAIGGAATGGIVLRRRAATAAGASGTGGTADPD